MTDDPLLRLGYLIIACILVSSISPQATTLAEAELTQDVFIKGEMGPFIPTATLASLGDPFNEYHSVYYEGVRMSELLTCLWLNESSYGKNMYGDYWNGKPLAYGHFQIWLHLHPEVSYDCAMDLDCSAKYTADEILAGRLWQWTTGNACMKTLIGA